MKKLLVVLMALVMATTAFAQKRPFAIEDLYRLKGVADPQIRTGIRCCRVNRGSGCGTRDCFWIRSW